MTTKPLELDTLDREILQLEMEKLSLARDEGSEKAVVALDKELEELKAKQVLCRRGGGRRGVGPPSGSGAGGVCVRPGVGRCIFETEWCRRVSSGSCRAHGVRPVITW